MHLVPINASVKDKASALISFDNILRAALVRGGQGRVIVVDELVDTQQVPTHQAAVRHVAPSYHLFLASVSDIRRW